VVAVRVEADAVGDVAAVGEAVAVAVELRALRDVERVVEPLPLQSKPAWSASGMP
jgi:hypothetical protein